MKNMKQIALMAVAAVMLSSCGSYMASGAYAGSSIGSILGSAIGGLSSGPRGSDWGSIVGMAGGAVIGGAIGNAADKARDNRIAQYHDQVLQREAQRGGELSQRRTIGSDDMVDTRNSGDDRIEFSPGTGGKDAYHAPKAEAGSLQISQVKYVDDDQVLRAGEVSKITFELRNTSSETLYNVTPSVLETTGNRHILVSPSINIESIAPGSGIRYTATVVGDRSLKKGTAAFEVSARADNGVATTVENFDIATSKR